MAQIVNNILNKLSLNIDGFKKSYKEGFNDYKKTSKISKDSVKKDFSDTEKTASKSFSNIQKSAESAVSKANKAISAGAKNLSFGDIVGANLVSAGLISAFSSISNGARDAVTSYEQLTSAISAHTGDLESAKDKYWELNALEDTLSTSTTELTDSFLKLSTSGFEASNELLTAIASMSAGSGRSLDEVTQAITDLAYGGFDGVKNLGIKAVDAGDKIQVSYNGITKTIDKTSDAISEFAQEFAKQNFSKSLESKYNTVSSSFNRLGNAFSSFQTLIFNADSAIGQVVISINDNITNMINDLNTALLNPRFVQTASKTFNGLKNEFKEVTDFWFDNLTEGLDKNNTIIADKLSISLIKFEEWGEKVKAVLAAVVASLDVVSSAINDYFVRPLDSFTNATSETINEFMDRDWSFGNISTNVFDAVNSVIDKTKDNFVNTQTTLKQSVENFNLVLDGATQSVLEKEKQTQNAIAETNKGLKERADIVKNTPSTPQVVKQPQTKQQQITTNLASSSLEKLKQEYARFYSQIEDLGKSDLQKETDRYNAKLTKLAEFHAKGIASETEYQNALALLEEEHQNKINEIKQTKYNEYKSLRDAQLSDNNEINQLFMPTADGMGQITEFFKNYQSLLNDSGKTFKQLSGTQQLGMWSSLTDGLSGYFEQLKNGTQEGSSTYRTLFAIQKGFAIASATVNAITAWSSALATQPFFPNGLLQYMNAISMTANVLAQLRSTNFSGAYDKGGYIAAGQYGIVGELGPEIIQGPVNVTSRKKTAELANSALQSGAQKNNNVTINLNEDSSKAGTTETTHTSEGDIISVFVSNIRKGGQVAKTLQSTFNLKRYGV